MKVLVAGQTAISRRVARDLSDLGVEVVQSDVHDFDVSEASLVIGAFRASPDEDFAAAQACIKASVSYLSACYDEDSYDALTSLDEDAKSAGALIVPGLTWSPGLTNIMAIATQPPSPPSEVSIRWVMSGAGGPDALARALHSLSGSAAVFEGGEWTRRRAGEESERVYFPEPIGWRNVRLAMGLEPLTIPRNLPGLERVTVKGGLTEGASDWLAQRLGRLTSLSPSRRRRRIGAMASSMIPSAAQMGGERKTWSAARVDISSADGSVTTLGVLDFAANLESAPLVVGGMMSLQGEIKGQGVLAPESAVEPRPFLKRLAERGVRIARLERPPSL